MVISKRLINVVRYLLCAFAGYYSSSEGIVSMGASSVPPIAVTQTASQQLPAPKAECWDEK